jgi:MFS family permease
LNDHRSTAAGGALIATLGITQIVGYGTVFYSFSPLMRPLEAALDASKGVVVGAFSLGLLTAAIFAVLVGKLIDRGRGSRVMAAGSAAAGLLLVALAQVDTVQGLYLVYLGLGVCMAAILYEPAFAVLTHAFGPDARRAITSLTLIAGFASTVFWPLTQFLIDGLGWRGAVVVLGGLNLVVCVPLHLFALPRRTVLRVSVPGAGTRKLGHALRMPVFYLFAGALVCNGLIFATMSVHIIPVLEAKGLSPLLAAGFAAMIGPMQVAGRVLESTVGPRFSIARVGVLALCAMPLALLLLLAASGGTWMVALFAVLYGASNGVFTIVRGAMPVELFGHEHYGAINGALSAPYLLSHAAGPSLAALLWTALGGSYDRVLVALALTATAGILFFALAASHRLRDKSL